MKITDYPLGEIPFEAMDRAINYRRYNGRTGQYEVALRHDFVPTNMYDDLRSGKMAEIIYWYPEYIDILYEHVIRGKDWRGYLHGLHPDNTIHFTYFFPRILKKLDKILIHTQKLNHLEETKIVNGRIII